jgi:D-alanyl-D-alanine-carboxypeptidase/D-alanyl-D-alanine-endopeptidase
MPNDSVASSAPAKPGEGASQLWRFLASYGVPRDIGSEWDYSNIGYWLLSQALASRAGTDFETLLQKRVIDRLGLASTAFRPTPKMKRNLAVGHDVALRPSPSFFEMTVYKDMPAAGGLVSTANDLLAFLAVTMGYQRSSLDPAIAAMLDTRRPMSRPRESQGLGWVVIGEGDDQLIGHDGGAWGYASSLAWNPKKRVGVVVLSNHVARVDDIARHLLRPSIPLAEPARKRTEIAVASTVLDTYAGRYEAAGEGVFVIARERDFLTIQLPADWGLPKLRLRPEGLRDFFVAELPLRVTFQAGGNGRIDGVLVHPPRGQKVVPAKRIN